MRIRRIELHGFKRMKLNDYHSISVDFDQPIQQILGTNGAGKSSMLSELNPLPGDHRDFEKGGKKHIWISHRGSEYECISDFMEGNKHTFIKDGIVLNDKGNAKIQSDLVYQEFKYNKQVRDLLLGRSKFTSMTTGQRRDWLTELSDVNYDYAIHIYLKLKERLRDITGSLREYKRRLVQESSKVLKNEEVTKLQKEVNQLHKEITELLDKRENPNIKLDDAISDQYSLLEQITSISKDILTTSIRQPIHVSNKEELSLAITEVQKQIAACDALLDQHTKDHNKIKREVDLLKQSGLDGLGQIEEKLIEFNKVKNQKSKFIHNSILFQNPLVAKDGIESIKEELLDICIHLPENSDRSINQNYSNTLKENLEVNYQRNNELQNQLNRYQATRLHLEEHKSKDSIQCPKCQHEWKLGFSEDRYQRTIENITETNKVINQLQEEKKTLTEKLQFVNEYGILLRRFKTITQSRPDLNPLWDYINREEILINNPKEVQILLNRVEISLQYQIEIEDINKEILKLEEVKKLSENTSLQNLSQAHERLDHYSLEMGKVTKDRMLLRLRESDLLAYMSEITLTYQKAEKLDKLIDRKEDLDKITVKAVIFDVITQALKAKQSQLAIKEDILSEVTNQKNIIYDLESQISKLSVDQQSLNVLVDQISPKEGLIAQGLLGFMNNFISKVNKVIAKVWSYPLQVQSCSVDAGETVELDYKFPLIVVDDNNKVDDISMGSDGMKEIINLAFVIVAMHCLDMKDYPVMLDEFSNTFDEAHRSSAVELVKNLLDQYSFSQLFIVSHYFTLHGALTNAQVCVLNDTNLSVSTVVNQHVTFQ